MKYKNEPVRIKAEAKKLLYSYKIDNECKSFSEAIIHAVIKARGEESENQRNT